MKRINPLLVSAVVLAVVTLCTLAKAQGCGQQVNEELPVSCCGGLYRATRFQLPARRPLGQPLRGGLRQVL
jgi:hypothetical protein